MLRIPPKTYSFDDVLLVPNFSDIKSRTDPRLDLSTSIGDVKLKTPIISANMDTVTELQMAMSMHNYGGLGIFHRFYKNNEEYISEIKEYYTKTSSVPFLSIGLKTPLSQVEDYQNIFSTKKINLCLDIANADNLHVHEYIRQLLKYFPSVNLIVGNICTKDAAKRLIDLGVRTIKTGIGPGCFTPNMLVNTVSGLVPISKIQVGDMVYTHTGQVKPVIALICYTSQEEVIKINNEIECTKNHEIYVIHKSHENIVNEFNIHEYAKWIKSENLTDEYLLVELVN